MAGFNGFVTGNLEAKAIMRKSTRQKIVITIRSKLYLKETCRNLVKIRK